MNAYKADDGLNEKARGLCETLYLAAITGGEKHSSQSSPLRMIITNAIVAAPMNAFPKLTLSIMH